MRGNHLTCDDLFFELHVQALAWIELASFDGRENVHDHALLIFHRHARATAGRGSLSFYLVLPATEIFDGLQIEHLTGQLHSRHLGIDIPETAAGSVAERVIPAIVGQHAFAPFNPNSCSNRSSRYLHCPVRHCVGAADGYASNRRLSKAKVDYVGQSLFLFSSNRARIAPFGALGVNIPQHSEVIVTTDCVPSSAFGLYRLSAHQRQEDPFKLALALEKPTVQREPLNTKSIEPTDRHDLTAIVSQLQIVFRPWGRGIIINRDDAHSFAIARHWNELNQI